METPESVEMLDYTAPTMPATNIKEIRQEFVNYTLSNPSNECMFVLNIILRAFRYKNLKPRTMQARKTYIIFVRETFDVPDIATLERELNNELMFIGLDWADMTVRIQPRLNEATSEDPGEYTIILEKRRR